MSLLLGSLVWRGILCLVVCVCHVFSGFKWFWHSSSTLRLMGFHQASPHPKDCCCLAGICVKESAASHSKWFVEAARQHIKINDRPVKLKAATYGHSVRGLLAAFAVWRHGGKGALSEQWRELLFSQSALETASLQRCLMVQGTVTFMHSVSQCNGKEKDQRDEPWSLTGWNTATQQLCDT